MATSGIRTRTSSTVSGVRGRLAGAARRGFVLLLSAALATALVGCVPNVMIGARPSLEHLPKLKPGVSTEIDVVRLLGQPRGRGVARFKSEMAPRNVWFYEHVETKGSDISLTVLLVVIHDGRYDGYLWFSSIEDIDIHWQMM